MRYRLLSFVAGLALASVAGCASPEELRRADETNCASYGFAPGTPDYDACLQREDAARQEYQHVDRHLLWVPAFGTGGI